VYSTCVLIRFRLLPTRRCPLHKLLLLLLGGFFFSCQACKANSAGPHPWLSLQSTLWALSTAGTSAALNKRSVLLLLLLLQ
jgi:hypothetical protein